MTGCRSEMTPTFRFISFHNLFALGGFFSRLTALTPNNVGLSDAEAMTYEAARKTKQSGP
jgi:hypothetical protein